MVEDDIQTLVDRLSHLVPDGAKAHGWDIRDLTHSVEVTPFGSEERWSVNFRQPTFYGEWKRMVGRPPQTLIVPDSVDNLVEAASPDDLMTLVAKIVDMFGLKDLRSP